MTRLQKLELTWVGKDERSDPAELCVISRAGL